MTNASKTSEANASQLLAAELRPSRPGLTTPPTRVGRIERVWVTVGSAGLFAWVVGLSAARGALGGARNDDWAYYRIAFRLAATSKFQLDHWTQAMLIGQAIAAWPVVHWFGPSIVALQLAVAGTGCVGVALAYLCVRRILHKRMALLAVIPLAFGPLFGPLAVSFMTDVPSMTLQVAAVYLSMRAIESPRRATLWWTVAMIAGVCGFTIREYGATTFAAVALAAVATATTSSQRIIRASTATLSGCAMAMLYLWRHNLPGNFPTSVRSGLHQLHQGQSYLLTLSLLLFPACWMVSWRRIGELIGARRRHMTTLVILAGLLIALAVGHRQVLGNYVSATGYAAPVGARPLLSSAGWQALLLIAATAEATVMSLAVVTASISSRTWRCRTPTEQAGGVLALMVTLGIAGQISLVLFSDSPAYDRYLLVFIPFAGALIIDAARRSGVLASGRGQLFAIAATIVYVIIGSAYVDRAAQYDGASWKLGTAAVAAGYDPTTIDAGYAWIGYHQAGTDAWPGAPNGAFWTHLHRHRCVLVSFRTTGPNAPSEPILGVARTTSPPGRSRDLVATLGPDHCSPAGPRTRR